MEDNGLYFFYFRIIISLRIHISIGHSRRQNLVSKIMQRRSILSWQIDFRMYLSEIEIVTKIRIAFCAFSQNCLRIIQASKILKRIQHRSNRDLAALTLLTCGRIGRKGCNPNCILFRIR